MKEGTVLNPPKRPSACFAGVRLEALLALERYACVESVITVPDSWVHRHCAGANRAVALVDRASRAASFEFISAQDVDMVLSSGFPFILPAEVLERDTLFINSHPSLLPAYKGRNAIQEAVEAGEPYLGVTVHHMVAKVDAGAQIVIP